MPPIGERCTLAFLLAVIGAAALSGCADLSARQAPVQIPPDPTPAVVSAATRANRADLADAQEVVLEYVDALRSRDATEAASLMTSYRRPETVAKGWKTEVRWWMSVPIKAVVHPGRYISDERAFAQLYAEHFGHAPYKLAVVNVSYGAGKDTPAGDTDFVVTRDNAGAPWLVHDFGGALQPSVVATVAP